MSQVFFVQSMMYDICPNPVVFEIPYNHYISLQNVLIKIASDFTIIHLWKPLHKLGNVLEKSYNLDRCIYLHKIYMHIMNIGYFIQYCLEPCNTYISDDDMCIRVTADMQRLFDLLDIRYTILCD